MALLAPRRRLVAVCCLLGGWLLLAHVASAEPTGHFELELYAQVVDCPPSGGPCRAGEQGVTPELHSGEAVVDEETSRFSGGVLVRILFARPNGSQAMLQLDLPRGAGGAPQVLYVEQDAEGYTVFFPDVTTGAVDVTPVDCQCLDGTFEIVLTDLGEDGAVNSPDDRYRRLRGGRFNVTGGCEMDVVATQPPPDRVQTGELYCPPLPSTQPGGAGEASYDPYDPYDPYGYCDDYENATAYPAYCEELAERRRGQRDGDGYYGGYDEDEAYDVYYYDEGGCGGEDTYEDDSGCEGDGSYEDGGSEGCEGDSSDGGCEDSGEGCEGDSGGCEGDSASGACDGGCEGDAFAATAHECRRTSARCSRRRRRRTPSTLAWLLGGLLIVHLQRRRRRVKFR